MARIVVIVPTYNRARTVGRAIDSVLAQDLPDVECLVVDDGSTDGTAEVLKPYAGNPRVRVVRLPTNQGVTGAKNAGLDGLPPDCEYFGILDSDDVLLPGALAKLLSVYEAAGNRYSQVFGWCEDFATREPTGTFEDGDPVFTYEDALHGRMQGEFWQLVRRSAVGDLRFDRRAYGQMSALWWRIMKDAPAYVVPDVVRRYDRSGTDRVSVVRFDPRTSTGRMWAYRAKLNAVGDDLRIVDPRRYAEHRLQEAKWAALANHRRESFAALGDAFGTFPSLYALRVAVVTLLPAFVLRRVYQLRYGAAPRA